MTQIEISDRTMRRLLGSALLALVLVLTAACGDDDSSNATGIDTTAEDGDLPADVEDIIEGADDIPEPVCDEELLTLEEISEATDLDFVACDMGGYQTTDGVKLTLQHAVYGSADEASAEHEGFAGTEPTSGDGWEGAAARTWSWGQRTSTSSRCRTTPATTSIAPTCSTRSWTPSPSRQADAAAQFPRWT